MRKETLYLSVLLLALTLCGVVSFKAEETVISPENPHALPGRFIDAHVHFQDSKAGDMEKIAGWMQANNVQRITNHPLRQNRPKDDKGRAQ